MNALSPGRSRSPRGRSPAGSSSAFLPAALSCVVVLGGFSGCSTLDLTDLPFRHPASYSEPSVGQPVEMQGSVVARRYQCIRQAKAQNSVVLEVVGDEERFRVLPLPTGERSVFVSHLLRQTGVLSKLGQVEATLYRYSSDSWAGFPMEVRMSKEGRQVRPESDYALRPGDRLLVEKHSETAVQSLVDMALAR